MVPRVGRVGVQVLQHGDGGYSDSENRGWEEWVLRVGTQVLRGGGRGGGPGEEAQWHVMSILMTLHRGAGVDSSTSSDFGPGAGAPLTHSYLYYCP